MFWETAKTVFSYFKTNPCFKEVKQRNLANGTVLMLHFVPMKMIYEFSKMLSWKVHEYPLKENQNKGSKQFNCPKKMTG